MLPPDVGAPVIPGFDGYGKTPDLAFDDLFEILANYYSAV
jgi:hypothetical protein